MGTSNGGDGGLYPCWGLVQVGLTKEWISEGGITEVGD